MAKVGQRKCMSCGEFFLPDHRSGERQRYCCAAACRRASKAASQACWLAKPPNNDYFSGPVHGGIRREKTSGVTPIECSDPQPAPLAAGPYNLLIKVFVATGGRSGGPSARRRARHRPAGRSALARRPRALQNGRAEFAWRPQDCTGARVDADRRSSRALGLVGIVSTGEGAVNGPGHRSLVDAQLPLNQPQDAAIDA